MNKDMDISNITSNEFTEWLFFEALETAKLFDKGSEYLKQLTDRNGKFDITFKINNHELDFTDCMKKFYTQYDSHVTSVAKELITDSIDDVEFQIENDLREIAERLKEKKEDLIKELGW
jgi:hypothetical protein